MKVGLVRSALVASLILVATAKVMAQEKMIAPGTMTQGESIAPGTVITPQNWGQYKNFMQDGLQVLFEGKYFWKLPSDFQMTIGPTHDYPLPEAYRKATEKYSHRVKIVNLPDGGHSITGYVAGMPFPNPSGPLQGWELLVDTWYAFVPHITCSPLSRVYLHDRYGNETQEATSLVYRQFTYIADGKLPSTDPAGPGIYYSEYTRVLAPEQSQYTTQLTLYYADPTKTEDLFLFIPALRRTLRLSAAARCSPFVGTDFTQDDVKQLFNGGIVRFDADYRGVRKTLHLTDADPHAWPDPNNYYQPVFFPKPTVGKWEVRDNYVLDVKRIPSQRKGYCYGSRMLYVDTQQLIQTWADIYDESLKLWKIYSFQSFGFPVGDQGKQLYSGGFVVDGWDMQNTHMTGWLVVPPFGNDDLCMKMNGSNYADAKQYSSVAGLSMIMR
ncbi:MAG: DUF1329 domain-containing protein [Candidatus Binataceae bacterium]|nr:DUF1329 domain-containing protein [Candidatus Binataceae bacterium]